MPIHPALAARLSVLAGIPSWAEGFAGLASARAVVTARQGDGLPAGMAIEPLTSVPLDSPAVTFLQVGRARDSHQATGGNP